MESKYTGSVTQYPEEEISKIPCSKCGKPSSQQWEICCNNNMYLGVCTECDYKLNVLIAEFMNLPNRDELLKEYKQKLNLI